MPRALFPILAIATSLLLSSFPVYSYRTASPPAAAAKVRLTMVEGHSVHRVASLHRKRLLGKRFSAVSPNGRFTAGAAAINGRLFSRIEAVGKNLFAFFGQETDKDDIVVVHVHFGMAGVWAVYQGDAVEDAPEPSTTNRLRLQADGLLADLSAMTVQHGTMDLYHEKRAKLGEDPLRDDSQPEALWLRVSRSKKSIGTVLTLYISVTRTPVVTSQPCGYLAHSLPSL